MITFGTPFQESEAILAAVQENYQALHAIMADMLPGERQALRQACERVMEEINFYER